MAASAGTHRGRALVQSQTILLIGDSRVGKSSLMLRFGGNYSDFIGPGSKGIGQRRYIIGQEHLVRVVLHDTDPNFTNMIESYYRFSVGILLMYAIDDQQSFDRLEFWSNHFQQFGLQNSEVAVIGTKSDLDASGQRQVSTHEASAFARAHGYSFKELSAREDTEVDAAIRIIACQIYAKVSDGTIEPERVRV